MSKVERKTYEAQDGKTYAFKAKNLNCRFVFGGKTKVWTADTAIESPEAMERLIASNDKKLEVVANAKSEKTPKAEKAPKGEKAPNAEKAEKTPKAEKAPKGEKAPNAEKAETIPTSKEEEETTSEAE
jgi:hypothetical protein